jgi:hypothetical protein
VVLDRLRREPTLRLQGYVGIDQLRASLELGEAVVAEEGEQVAIEHVAIVLDGRRLEVPPRQVVADEAVGEVGKRDAVGLAETLVDGGESLAELALRHALGPRRLRSERFEHLSAGGIAVFDPPDWPALALVADDCGSSRHRSSSGRDPWAVSPERACLLLGDPGYDCLLSVADVVSELDVGDAAAAGVFAHPAHRDAEQLGDVGGGEQAITHVY